MGRTRRTVYLRLAGLLFTANCATSGPGGTGPNAVTGLITPDLFKFKTINRTGRGKQPGGWRAVCIHAFITHGNTGASTLCDFEVSVPGRTGKEGDIDVEDARQFAANRANQAAYEILSQAQPGEMLAVLCYRFRRRYQELLKQDVGPALVSSCLSEGLTPIIFNLPATPLPSPL